MDSHISGTTRAAATDTSSATGTAQRFRQIQETSTVVINPTQVASSRCVCSKKIPPTQRVTGKVNILYP